MRRTRTLITALLAICALWNAACTEGPVPSPERRLVLRESGIPIHCGDREHEWKAHRSGRTARYGIRQRAGSTCHFILEVPEDSALAFRVEALPTPGRREASLRAVLSMEVDGRRHALLEEVLEASQAIERKLALEAGRASFVMQAEPLQRPGGNLRLDWTDLVFETRSDAPLPVPPWTVPAAEALAPYWEGARPEPSGRRLLLVGIDGGRWDLMEPLIAKGALPHLARLRSRGRWGVLESTPVPESAMAWTSMRTGVNPGKHGVFIFYSPDTQRRSYWHLLGDHGLRSIVVAVPKASPSRPLHGVLVGGWTFRKELVYAWPPELQQHLERTGFDPGLVYVRNTGYFREHMRLKTDVTIELLEHLAWDHAFVVYEYSDTVGHLFGLNTPEYEEVYRDVDALVGRLLEHVPRDTTVLVVSDHGWAAYPRSVNVDAWLRKNGFPDLKATPPTSGDVISVARRTGLPSEPGAERLRRVRTGLEAIQNPADAGGVIQRVALPGALFSGPYRAPVNLVVQAAPGYRAVLKTKGSKILSSEPLEHHFRDGLYLLAGPGVPAGEGPRSSIYDVAPTVLRFFGIAPPEDAEGEALHDFGVPVASQGETALYFDAPPAADPALEAPEALDERLRALGYIE
jgi:predicted AlkP superfamily phosphohydrolase/phosphomutase